MSVTVSLIAPGNAGVLQTAARMIALMRIPSRAVTVQAEAIADTVPSRAPSAVAMAVYTWVQSHMRYTHDGDAPDAHPLERGEEGLRSPEYLLRGIANWGYDYGDCDDYVILMGALLLRLGVPVTIVLTSARDDGEYDHVFLKVRVPEGDLYADAITGQPFGWHILDGGRVTAREELPV